MERQYKDLQSKIIGQGFFALIEKINRIKTIDLKIDDLINNFNEYKTIQAREFNDLKTQMSEILGILKYGPLSQVFLETKKDFEKRQN